MKRFGIALAVLTAVALVLAAGVVADEGGTKPPRPTGLSGTIAKIEGSTLAIATKREGQPAAEQTVTVDSSTEIAIDVEAKLADLKAGDRARIGGTFGEIGRIEGQSVTFVKRGEGGTSEQTVTVGADTPIFVRRAGSLADLKVGQRVGIQHLDGKAVRIEVPAERRGGKEGGKEGGAAGREKRVGGEVTQVGANSITISRPAGEGASAGTKEETFTVGSDAKIVIEGAAAGLSDLKVGQKVVITYEGPAALRIEVPRTKRGGEGEGDRRPESTTPAPPRAPESERKGESSAPVAPRTGGEGER